MIICSLLSASVECWPILNQNLKKVTKGSGCTLVYISHMEQTKNCDLYYTGEHGLGLKVLKLKGSVTSQAFFAHCPFDLHAELLAQVCSRFSSNSLSRSGQTNVRAHSEPFLRTLFYRSGKLERNPLSLFWEALLDRSASVICFARAKKVPLRRFRHGYIVV